MYVCGQEGRIQWLHGDVRCVPVCVIVLEGEGWIGTVTDVYVGERKGYMVM